MLAYHKKTRDGSPKVHSGSGMAIQMLKGGSQAGQECPSYLMPFSKRDSGTLHSFCMWQGAIDQLTD